MSTQNDAVSALFQSLFPNHFEQDYIRELPDGATFHEMILKLDNFDVNVYKKKPDNVSFGFYNGNISELKQAVHKVEKAWTDFFNENSRAYCGFVSGKIASFCLIDDMGSHTVNGQLLKIGGPGCVGTLPEYRGKGIGLTMVKNATEILKKKGFAYSYIHFTDVEQWYARLGYKICADWDKNGIIRCYPVL